MAFRYATLPSPPIPHTAETPTLATIFLMTDGELKKLTKDFTDIKVLLEKRDEIKRDDNKVRRRLRTQFSRYDFLKDIVDIGCRGDRLVNALVKYFKAVGFDRVENVDKEFEEEDIRLWTEDSLIIFEVTGVDKLQPKHDKAHSVSRHMPARKSEYPNLKVYGGFIINHDNNKHYLKRNPKPFDEKIRRVALGHKYSLLTTVDLLRWFLELEKGTIDKKEILKRICIE